MHLHSLKALAALGILLFPWEGCWGQPGGFRLKNGSASAPTLQQDGSLFVKSGPYAEIDWESFSLSRADKIIFNQEAQGVVVNRVVGGLKSDILGQIHSNGAVYLINPKGIFIGSSALIETAGFIASTHDLLSSDLSENLRFAGESNAAVVNEGVIRCGNCDVFLIGQTVDERGHIQAGKVGLLSGCEVLIRAGGEAPLVVKAEDSVDEKMFRQNPYALAIKHKGTLVSKELYVQAGEGIIEESARIETKAAHFDAPAVRVMPGAYVKADSLEMNGHAVLLDQNTDIHAQAISVTASDLAQVYGTMSGLVQIDSEGRLGFGASITGGSLQIRSVDLKLISQPTPKGYDVHSISVNAPGGSFADLSKVNAEIALRANRSLTIDHPPTAAGSVTLDAPAIYLTKSWNTTAQVALHGSLTIGSSLRIQAKKLDIHGSIEADNQYALTLAAQQGVVLDGSLQRLGSLTVENGKFLLFTPRVCKVDAASINIFPQVLLQGDTELTTSSSGGSITLRSAVQGSGSIALNAGAGEISIQRDIGPLDRFTILSAFKAEFGSQVSSVKGAYFKVAAPVPVYCARDLLVEMGKEASFGGLVNGSRALTVSAPKTYFGANIGQTGKMGALSIVSDACSFGRDLTKISTDAFLFKGRVLEIAASGPFSLQSASSAIIHADLKATSRDVQIESPKTQITDAIHAGNFYCSGKTVLDSSHIQVERFVSAPHSDVLFTNEHVILDAKQTIDFGGSLGFHHSGSVKLSAPELIFSQAVKEIQVKRLRLHFDKMQARSLHLATPVIFGENPTLYVEAEELAFLEDVKMLNKQQVLNIHTQSPLMFAKNVEGGSVHLQTDLLILKGEKLQVERFQTSGSIACESDHMVLDTKGFSCAGEISSSGTLHGNAGEGLMYIGADLSVQGDLKLQASAITLGSMLKKITASSIEVAKDSPIFMQHRGDVKMDAAGGKISFGGALDGPANLELCASEISLLENVGKIVGLGDLLLDASSQVSFGAGARCIFARSLSIPQPVPLVLLARAETQVRVADKALFSGSINSELPGGHGLGVKAKEAVFLQNIGDERRFGSLSILSDHLTLGSSVNSFCVSTLSVAPAIRFSSTEKVDINVSRDVRFDSSVLSASDLFVRSSHASIAMKGGVQCQNLAISAHKQIQLGASRIDAGNITLDGAVYLDGKGTAILNATGPVLFNASVDGPGSLELHSKQNVCFEGNCGANLALADVRIHSEKTVQLPSFIKSQKFAVDAASEILFNTHAQIQTESRVLLNAPVFAKDLNISCSKGEVAFGGDLKLERFEVEKAQLALFKKQVSSIEASSMQMNTLACLQAKSVCINGQGGAFSCEALEVCDLLLKDVKTAAVSDVLNAHKVWIDASDAISLNHMNVTDEISLNARHMNFLGTIKARDMTVEALYAIHIGKEALLEIQDYFRQCGPGFISMAGRIDAEKGLQFDSAIRLNGLVEMRTLGKIAFKNELDGPGSLTMRADQVHFEKKVGQSPLSGLLVEAKEIRIDSDHTVSQGSMEYKGEVILSGPIHFNHGGSGEAIFHKISSSSDCTIVASHGAVQIGEVDLRGHPDGSAFSLTAGGDIEIPGSILTYGDFVSGGSGGNVSITSHKGSISIGKVDASGAPSATGGSIQLSPCGIVENGIPKGTLELNGPLFSLPLSPRGGDISLSANRSRASSVATIHSGTLDNDIVIRAKSCNVGPYECITGLSSVELHADVLSLGNLAAAKDLSLHAKTIHLQTVGHHRDAHFVCGGEYTRVGNVLPMSETFYENTLDMEPQMMTLKMDGVVLNYDSHFTVSAVTGSEWEYPIYQLNVASAQLSDALPIYAVKIPDYFQSAGQAKPQAEKKTLHSGRRVKRVTAQ